MALKLQENQAIWRIRPSLYMSKYMEKSKTENNFLMYKQFQAGMELVMKRVKVLIVQKQFLCIAFASNKKASSQTGSIQVGLLSADAFVFSKFEISGF
jgi:hypothetical protein